MWFRIELDGTGAILSCTEVELAEKQGRLVRFVEAPDKAGACSSVKQWYEHRCRTMVEKRQVMIARRHAEGKCTDCEKPSAPGVKMCQTHIERRRAYGKRDRMRARGEAPPPERPIRLEPRIAYLAQCEPALKASRIIFELDRLGPVAFRAWVMSLLREKLSKVA